MFNRIRVIFFAAFLSLAFVAPASAGDLDWSGVYRIEGYTFDNPLAKGGKRKEYGVHHLILRPRIVGADGLYINSQLNIFNNRGATWGDQLGSVFGNGVDDDPAANTSSNSGTSNTLSERQEPEQIRISQFYLTMVQEFGSLLVGRAPVQFGLGMTHSAGRGMFDHYMDTRDLVAYKMVMGNFFFMPMMGKVNEGDIGGYDDVNDLLVQLQYDNSETDTSMGVMYWNRKAGMGGNDAQGTTPNADDVFGNTATVVGNYDYEVYNFFFSKKTDNYSFGIEVANQSGDTGVSDGTSNIEFSGMGVAMEFGYHPKEKRWATGFKAGYATGDDKSTTDEYEGFVFDRNYDVAMILFNHAVGQLNVLHTEINGTKFGTTRNSPLQDPDIESISNVTYLAPYFTYKWSDRWSLNTVLATGWVDQTKLALGGDTDEDLGYELDFALSFTPNERVTWQNTVGWFMPGKAFEGGDTNNFSTGTVFGIMSRAAISF